MYKCFVDGGCNNVTHSGAYGSYAIFGVNRVLNSATFLLNSKTSNEAEYGAYIKLLEYIVSLPDHNKHSWRVISDSKLVVNQISGITRCEAKNLLPLYHKTKKLMSNINDITIHWTRRKNIKKILGH